MADREAQHMTLAQLAEAAGVPPRTVRFYISRGLLDGPGVAGRGAVYDRGHLERLRHIRGLQSRGLTLVEIGRELEGPQRVPQPASWWRYDLAPDVTVSVSAGAPPWRLREIHGALEEFVRRLGSGDARKSG